MKMKKAKQLGFEILENKNAKYFGGAYLKDSNPKTKRPITTKRSMHLVLRSVLAKGAFSLLKKERIIAKIIYKQAKVSGVKIYRFANGGNHLHLIVRPCSRASFNIFIRSISGIIAREILGAQRGNAKNLKFWEKRPYTQVIEWGRQYQTLLRYLDQNALEAWGFIPYKPRKIVPGRLSTA